MKVLSTMPGIPTIEILGTRISTLNMEETLDVLDQYAAGSEPHLVVTADSTALVIANQRPAFQEILNKASFITADSVGIMWAMRRKGIANPNKVSGVDMVDHLCRLSAERGYRLYFIGSEPGVTELAAERFRLRYPGVNIVGTQHGYFDADSDEIIAQAIAETRPDFLFVAMGMPRQEEFILKTQHLIRAKVAMGVGGSFDVYSGKTRRAPKFVQKLHLEWFWRLMLNPSKFSKVRSLPIFVGMILRSK